MACCRRWIQSLTFCDGGEISCSSLLRLLRTLSLGKKLRALACWPKEGRGISFGCSSEECEVVVDGDDGRRRPGTIVNVSQGDAFLVSQLTCSSQRVVIA